MQLIISGWPWGGGWGLALSRQSVTLTFFENSEGQVAYGEALNFDFVMLLIFSGVICNFEVGKIMP